MSRNHKMLDRLKSQAVFQLLRGSDIKWITPAFVVHILEDKSLLNPVMAITVSKKASPKAVGRVRLRRRLRALAQEILPDYAQSGFIYGLTARQEAMARDFEQMKKDLLWALRKLDKLKEKI